MAIISPDFRVRINMRSLHGPASTYDTPSAGQTFTTPLIQPRRIPGKQFGARIALHKKVKAGSGAARRGTDADR
jgi:hypothetical protein